MRRGLGRGLGTGYKNLAPMDSHIHSLSAKGIKTLVKNYQNYIYDVKGFKEEEEAMEQGIINKDLKLQKIYDDLINYKDPNPPENINWFFEDENNQEEFIKENLWDYNYRESEEMYLSPDQFLNLVIGDTKNIKYYGWLFPIVLQTYIEQAKAGKSIPEPYLEIDKNNNVVYHNGRHRAMAMKILGIKKIPVRVWGKLDKNTQPQFKID